MASSEISDEESEVGWECIGETRKKNVHSRERCGGEMDDRKRNRVYRSSIAKNEIYAIGWKKTRVCQKEERRKMRQAFIELLKTGKRVWKQEENEKGLNTSQAKSEIFRPIRRKERKSI